MSKKSNPEELAKAKAKANDDEEEPEEGSEENEEEDKMSKKQKGDAKKAEDLSQDDLQKSLDQLESVASEGDKVTRKQTLLAKAQTEELDKSEKDELFQILGAGDKSDEPTLADEVVKGMGDNEDLQKALDVSEYLQENQNELKKSLSVVAEHIEKSDNRQHEFNLILAKAVSSIGKNILGMGERLGVIEEQPARAPKSKGIQPLEKGFANQQPQGEQLSKSEILNGLSEMVEESVSKGMNGALEDGTDLVMASSKFEQFNAINPTLVQRVQKHIQSKRSAV